ncbi:MAG: hypothetical protein GXO89_16750 [Chlorobi bacterium]|nr:hypothetical protein [Chlorobiota bacterium]
MRYNKTHIARLIFPVMVISLLFVFSCGKDEQNQGQGIIPNVYVNFTIYPNTIDYIPPGGYIYYNDQGNRGIILYRLDQNLFYAYERTCPYDPDKDCARVEVETSGVIAVDSCCMSQYILLDGSPFSGPSTLPLKQYRIQYDGSTLTVINTP